MNVWGNDRIVRARPISNYLFYNNKCLAFELLLFSFVFSLHLFCQLTLFPVHRLRIDVHIRRRQRTVLHHAPNTVFNGINCDSFTKIKRKIASNAINSNHRLVFISSRWYFLKCNNANRIKFAYNADWLRMWLSLVDNSRHNTAKETHTLNARLNWLHVVKQMMYKIYSRRWSILICIHMLKEWIISSWTGPFILHYDKEYTIFQDRFIFVVAL